MKRLVQAHIVHAFASPTAAGSRTGVILEADDLDDESMRSVARALAVSHTAFLGRPRRADCLFSIRFFTPGGELKNCAHATIAAHHLWATKHGTERSVEHRHETIAGVQDVRVEDRGQELVISFKQNPITQKGVDETVTQRLTLVVGCGAADLAMGYPMRLMSPGTFRFLLPLSSLDSVLRLDPDFTKLNELCKEQESMGCFAFYVEESEHKGLTRDRIAHARMFAPSIGVNEDAVNGNSSGCLGAYLIGITNAEQHQVSELELKVHQGHRSGSPSVVNVSVKQTKAGEIETFVGGTARSSETLEVSI